MSATPGPWLDRRDRINADNGALVAQFWTKPSPADAALMVAAPDMYLALKHCLGILCESGDLNNYRNLSDAELGRAWTETAKEATIALNKAEGRAP